MSDVDERRSKAIERFEGNVPDYFKDLFEEYNGEPFDKPIIRESTPCSVLYSTKVHCIIYDDYEPVPASPELPRHKNFPAHCLSLPSAACFMKGWGNEKD
jgi:hypothetical protein